MLSALVAGDLNKLEPAAAAAARSVLPADSGARGLKLLWSLLERFKLVRVKDIEKAAFRHGVRAEAVEAVFVATASDPVVQAAVASLVRGDTSALAGLPAEAVGRAVQAAATASGLPTATVQAVVAAVLSLVMVLALTTAWLLGKVTDRPLTEIVTGLAWWGHFDAFRTGLVHLKHVTYFGFVTFIALFAATRVLEARRWR
jgi:TctA family transporter